MNRYYKNNDEQIKQFGEKYQCREIPLAKYMKMKKDEHDDKDSR